MSKAVYDQFDPNLDLVLERVIDVPVSLVWVAWTTPEHLKHWFVPRPWTVSECELDVRPGGLCRTVMRSPEGREFPNVGCYLEVAPNQRLVFTDAMGPGFRPSAQPFFTAIINMEAVGKDKTRYTAIAVHRDPDGKQKHEEMGFHVGWGIALDQLVEYVKGIGH
jgi:uncharacterized protein YndB with AHSA1/START domain